MQKYYKSLKNVNISPVKTLETYSYAKYVDSVFRKWCSKQDINYSSLVASLQLLCLSGEVLVKQREAGSIAAWNNQSRVHKIEHPIEKSQFTYELANSYGIKISNDQCEDIALGFRAFLLDKLTNV